MDRDAAADRQPSTGGWTGLVTAGATAAAAIRMSERAGRHPLGIGIQGLVPWLLLPAYPAALLAAARGRAGRAAVLTALAAAHARWTSAEAGLRPAAPAADPQSSPATGPRTAPAAGPQSSPATGRRVALRLATANLLLDNPDPAALVAGLSAAGPDVLLLQELTPEHLAKLEDAKALEPYPYRVLDPRPWVHGGAILSRLPLSGGRSFDCAGSPLTEADVATPAGPLHVVNVHLVAPLDPARILTWHEQHAELARRRPGGLVVLAGDFNATAQHRPLAALLRAGYRDAQRVAGGGLAPTWPTTGRPGFPLLRLDHVLVGPGIGVTGIRRAQGPGSDHRPLVADLTLPR